MGSCKNCDFTGETHFHHIVPKSRGGSDSEENLIEVCYDCHRKIHNAEFGGDGGLIKDGISNKKRKGKESNQWVRENYDLICDFIFDFSEKHDTDIISDMMNLGMMNHLDFMECVKEGSCKSMKGDLPKMIFDFARSAKQYNILAD